MDADTACLRHKRREEMIKEATYYEVICDKCGERMCLDGITAWESEEDAKEALDYVGWQEMESGRVYCDACLVSGERDGNGKVQCSEKK